MADIIPARVEWWHVDPVIAAERALAQRGYVVHEDSLRPMVAAVLATFDGIADRRQMITREVTESAPSAMMVSIRRDMRRRLAESMMDAGQLPVALPVESVRYLMGPAYNAPEGDLSEPLPDEVPADVVASGQLHRVPWKVMLVVLECPYRLAKAAGRG